MKLVSFDIFDTCLIRKCGIAENVFYLFAKRLYPDDCFKSESFYLWRCWAEAEVKRQLKTNTVTLVDIYSILDRKLYNEFPLEFFISKEMEMEMEMLELNPAIVPLIREKRSNGYRIAYISDMYLGSNFLVPFLKSKGLFNEEDYVFVSCEKKASKSKGDLYDLVNDALQPRVWEHYGDNFHSDVKNAAGKGIKATQVFTWWTKAEQTFLDKIDGEKHKNELSCLIGFIRYARIQSGNTAVSEISANFVVPIFTAYVFDVLQTAQKEGVKRLYFLARDGYILKWIADQFSCFFPEIELKYLYVSRKSLFLPSLNSLDRNEIEQYFGDQFKYTNVDLFKKYFKLDELFEIFKIEFDFKSLYPNNNQRVFFEAINQTKIKQAIFHKSTSERVVLMKYLEQEGLFEDIKYAMVDVGWKGSGRFALNKLLELHGVGQKPFFYWGTYSEYRNNFPGIACTYNLNQRLPLFVITLVEDYFSASPDCSTLSYKKTNNTIVEPVFDETSLIDNSVVLKTNKQVLHDFIKCIVDYKLVNSNLLDITSLKFSSILINDVHKINLEALHEISCFNEKKGIKKGLVHRMSLIDTIKFSFGRRVNTNWDEACVKYTYPQASYLLIFIHKFVKRISLFILR